MDLVLLTRFKRPNSNSIKLLYALDMKSFLHNNSCYERVFSDVLVFKPKLLLQTCHLHIRVIQERNSLNTNSVSSQTWKNKIRTWHHFNHWQNQSRLITPSQLLLRKLHQNIFPSVLVLVYFCLSSHSRESADHYQTTTLVYEGTQLQGDATINLFFRGFRLLKTFTFSSMPKFLLKISKTGCDDYID